MRRKVSPAKRVAQQRPRKTSIFACDFSAWARGEMKRQGVSQADVAIASNLSPTSVFNVLKGRNCRLNTAATIAGSLGYRVELTFKVQ